MQADAQSRLARLFTDAVERNRFLTQRTAYLNELPVEIRTFFEAIDPAEIESFANALIRKRFSEMRGCLPRTQRHFSVEQLREQFTAYTQTHPIPSGVNKIPMDAYHFAQYLRKISRLNAKIKYAIQMDAAYLSLQLHTKWLGIRIVNTTILVRFRYKIHSFFNQ